MEDGSHQTALHLLVRYMALSAVHILVSHGADVNAADSNGMTPLHMAAGGLHKDTIACLIKEGADINMVCLFLFKCSWTLPSLQIAKQISSYMF